MKILILDVFVFCLFTLLTTTDAKKLRILVTSQHISYSHIKFQGHLADILAAEGHYVVRNS